MLVELAKRKDGAGVLRCVRGDGSVTWQKQNQRNAAYFALNDLTHFAVESVLGYQRGFFGLLREGWDFDDTTGKGAKGPLPPEAGEVEGIVGRFFIEQASEARWTAEEFCDSLPRKLTDDELAQVRRRRGELFAAWAAVEPGCVLNLKFPS
ncbi:MAG TPA: hypothetical protein VHC90_26170 [Bryobacteraceae bacterium]|nr:hypothetical protein [Bryobacteraceae bacterium]